MSAWQIYDEWWTVPNKARNNAVFHNSEDCPRLDNKNAMQRTESYMAFHDLRPCSFCHDEVENDTGDTTTTARTSLRERLKKDG